MRLTLVEDISKNPTCPAWSGGPLVEDKCMLYIYDLLRYREYTGLIIK